MSCANNYDILDGKENAAGGNIKKRREELHMSRQELSDKLLSYGIEISAQSIDDIEQGKREIIYYEFCFIAKILDIPMDYLMKDFNKKLKMNQLMNERNKKSEDV